MNQKHEMSEIMSEITNETYSRLGSENGRPYNKKDKRMLSENARTTDAVALQQFYLRPTTMDDLEPAVALFNLSSNHIYGRDEVTLNQVHAEWLLPEFDVETATRVAISRDAQLVGYVEVWDIDELPVNMWVWGRVHPQYEGLGIGSALMDWAERRARRAAERVPQGIKVVMRSGTVSGFEPATALLRNRGMKPIRHFYTMAIELDEEPPMPQFPDGITVRPMKGPEEARDVVWATEDAFRDHWGFVEQPFENQLERWLHFMEHEEGFDPELWYLAMDGDEVTGVALCMSESHEDENMGWVRTLGVRRPWRRQGLGLALLHYCFGEFYRLGKARVGLGVDASSLTGATRLYERAGMKPIRQFDTFELVLRPGRDISTQELKQQSAD